MRVIALVGAGAISSAAICSLYLAYTLDESTAEILGMSSEAPPPIEESGAEPVPPPDHQPGGQAFLVAFLANADPQVRTLAAWGLVSGEEANDRQREILDFVQKERDPEVRVALYRFLHGQRSINASTLVELVKQEDDLQTWLAGCDLLAEAIREGAGKEAAGYFNQTIVPELKTNAVNGKDLHCKVAAIIALRRAGTGEALKALREIMRTSEDEQVVDAASSAVGLSMAADQ